MRAAVVAQSTVHGPMDVVSYGVAMSRSPGTTSWLRGRGQHSESMQVRALTG